MIVVTGNARTGTSLQMQTLMHLGIPVLGDAQRVDIGPPEFNPKGYYNVPVPETAHGVKEPYPGKAIKLDWISLLNTDPSFIERIIVCDRDLDTVIQSQLTVMDGIDLGIDINEETLRAGAPVVEKHINDYIEKNKIDRLDVKYEDMLENPEFEIECIAIFVGSGVDPQDAINNVERGMSCLQPV